MQKIYAGLLIGLLVNGHATGMKSKVDITNNEVKAGGLLEQRLLSSLKKMTATLKSIDEMAPAIKSLREMKNRNKELTTDLKNVNEPFIDENKLLTNLDYFLSECRNNAKKQRATKTRTKHTGYKKKTTRSNVSTTITKNVTKKTKFYQNTHASKHTMLTRSRKNYSSQE